MKNLDAIQGFLKRGLGAGGGQHGLLPAACIGSASRTRAVWGFSFLAAFDHANRAPEDAELADALDFAATSMRF